MITGRMLHEAHRQAYDTHRQVYEEIPLVYPWEVISEEGRTLYRAMANLLNDAVVTSLHVQIEALTDTVLKLEQERDAFQQLALAQGESHA